MTDIVDRLRRYVGSVCVATNTEMEAADYIERLRREMMYLRKCADELEALKVAIAREIDHAEINRIRTAPAFGKSKGEVAVPVRSLLAVIEGIKYQGE